MSTYKSLAGEPGAHNVGNDARHASTRGIHLHHLCLRIKDPKVSLPFYKDILGMKTLFTYNAGSFSIYCTFRSSSRLPTCELISFLAPRQTCTIRTRKTTLRKSGRVSRSRRDCSSRHGSEDESLEYCSGNEVEHQGFGHLGSWFLQMLSSAPVEWNCLFPCPGLMVDDVPGTVRRAEEAGYKVIKRQGEASAETVGWPKGTPEPIKPYIELYSQMAMIQASLSCCQGSSSDTSADELAPRMQGPDHYWFELARPLRSLPLRDLLSRCDLV
ncbi:SPOSA6832_00187, partial [Sporobolomyces salmonicolor]